MAHAPDGDAAGADMPHGKQASAPYPYTVPPGRTYLRTRRDLLQEGRLRVGHVVRGMKARAGSGESHAIT